ncbi:alpha/beta-hydrolase [Poronia punctata]|nr:alpha/beta-hydrolase [Poronia punctata]
MPSNVKHTILIVHGGWHVPESYTKLTTALESSGYEVHIPHLPSVKDVRPPTGDLYSDTDVIRSYAENLVQDGRHVVALMHSYGGQVGTNAMHGLGVETRATHGLQGGISHLIYMAAYALPEGTAMMEKVKEFGHMHLVPLAFDIAEEDFSCLSRDPKMLLVGPGPDEEEMAKYLDTFTRWNGKCMYQPIRHAAWRDIPVSYIHSSNDMTVPMDYQKNFVQVLEKEGREVRTFDVASGHCPNFTATEGVVDAINKIVRG